MTDKMYYGQMPLNLSVKVQIPLLFKKVGRFIKSEHLSFS
jgi:hypothetical protein